MPFWESSIFWGIVSVLGIILSAIISYHFSSRKILSYKMHSTILLNEDITTIHGLTIKMHDKTVNNLIVTRLTFFNAGNQPIKSDDFFDTDPFRVFVSGTYFDSIIYADNPNTHPTIVTLDEHTYNIKFNYLKQGENFYLTLWHDGDISVCGDFINGKLLNEDSAKKNNKKERYISYIQATQIIFIQATLICAFLSVSSGHTSADASFFEIVFSPLFPVAYLASSLFLIILENVFACLLVRWLNKS